MPLLLRPMVLPRPRPHLLQLPVSQWQLRKSHVLLLVLLMHLRLLQTKFLQILQLQNVLQMSLIQHLQVLNLVILMPME